MHDIIKSTNGTYNSMWGVKAWFMKKKAYVSTITDCNPLKPQNCPRKNPKCVKYTVTDANFSNWRYQQWSLLAMGKLNLGVTHYACVDTKSAREMMKWMGRKDFWKHMGWKYKAHYVLSRKASGKRKGGKRSGMKGMRKGKGGKKMRAMLRGSATHLGASILTAATIAMGLY